MQQPPDGSLYFNVAPFGLLLIELPVILLKRKLDNLSPLDSPTVTQSKLSSLYNGHQSPELSGLFFLFMFISYEHSLSPTLLACFLFLECCISCLRAFVLAVFLSRNHHSPPPHLRFGYHSSLVLTRNSPYKVGNLKRVLQIYEQGVGKALDLVPQRTRSEVRGLSNQDLDMVRLCEKGC